MPNRFPRGHEEPLRDYFYPEQRPEVEQGASFETPNQDANETVETALTKIKIEDVPGNNARNKFLARFGNIWLPPTEGAASLAVKGLVPSMADTFSIVGRSVQKRNERLEDEDEWVDPVVRALDAAGEKWYEANHYKEQADSSLAVLHRLYEVQNRLPTPTEIIYDPQAREVLAEFMLAHSSLNRNSWQPKQRNGQPNKSRQNNLENNMTALRLADPELVGRLYQRAKLSFFREVSVWNAEIDSAKAHPLTLDYLELEEKRYKQQVQAEWEALGADDEPGFTT